MQYLFLFILMEFGYYGIVIQDGDDLFDLH